MKTIIVLLSSAVALVAADIRLAWDPVPGVAGYRVYAGTNSRAYTIVTTNYPSAGTNRVSGLQSGTVYYFAVVSVAGGGQESDFSNEVSGMPNPAAPVLRIVTTNTLQSALSPEGPWQDETNFIFSMAADGPRRFVRTKIDITQ
jgi:fibronectin type 3 domain-containing protein